MHASATPHPDLAAATLGGLRARLAARLASIERAFDRAFTPEGNPWRHLGALGYFLFWIVAASGIWVYVGFDTSADGAYASVERLTGNAFPLGAIARSLHRYASDAFVLVVILHLAREWILGRYAHFRRFSWLTGVATLWLVYASGIGGFWLVWDQLAQYSLIATAEWLDALPLLGQLARNFDAGEKVSDRLFSLLIFLHIGFPLALLALMWVHLQRLARPDTVPPRVLGWGTAGVLVAISLLAPVASMPAADLASAPQSLALDWFYLGVHAFADAAGVHALWLVTVALTALLALLPWFSREARAPRAEAARVDLAQCNGCARCFADCPYMAITMEPRADGRRHARQPLVSADLCAGCGICAGSCPSSTPFRVAETLRTGIDMPQLPMRALRHALDAAIRRLARSQAHRPSVIVFGCAPEQAGSDIRAFEDERTAVLPLLCAAQLPPSFVEYALRAGVDGVMIAVCETDCAFRLGKRWTAERIAGLREPRLRAGVPRERMHIAPLGHDGAARFARALAELRDRVATQPRRVTPPKRVENAHVSAF
jgi:quinol-cytochrome oxidoreductase complex cytochrome b subunit/coenzyme F420-reducing hydrogenase delta subunit/Pyruvate/2-oxoacid:ferredoxin oxidoreductase delta subunit